MSTSLFHTACSHTAFSHTAQSPPLTAATPSTPCQELSNQDLSLLADVGLTESDVARQLSHLRGAATSVALDRPCTTNDGIQQLTEAEFDELVALHRAAASSGRWTKFVPASGAASRMFSLGTDEEKKRFCESLDQFAFGQLIADRATAAGIDIEQLRRTGKHDEIIDFVLSPGGLGYGNRPKGLINFHSYLEGPRTPFEEHLQESLACLSGPAGTTKSHFTIGTEHQDQFAERLRDFQARLQSGRAEVDFSIQSRSTDTIALDHHGQLLRHADGTLVLRPGGHGALIENLDGLHGDLVFVKNIDNVGHQATQAVSRKWIEIIGGMLVRLQNEVHQHLRALHHDDDRAVSAALRFVKTWLPGEAHAVDNSGTTLRGELIKVLRRPLRVCGMVKNEGEPGGGPYWVRDTNGRVTPQIVESAEVNTADDGQRQLFEHATHFNPVFMALGLRDEEGRPFRLTDFVNDNRMIVTSKNVNGEEARVLERPGLWNGAMGGWNSVFVEVPGSVFSPVKSVFDLLRSEHQPCPQQTEQTANRKERIAPSHDRVSSPHYRRSTVRPFS